jgi:multiple sugar transport system ATP-binding protein
MVFQNYALYPHMTVKQNMGFALRLRRVQAGEIDRQVREIAQLLGLSELLDRKPAALSGGQRQRVAMGRAMVRQPRVFLMDEPLSNLDAKLRVSMRAELSRLHQRYRVTTVYVTHDQVEAMTLGDRIAVIDRGRLQQVGTPEELYQAPANRFVAGFMGSPSMNFATVTLEGEDPVGTTLGGVRFDLPDVLARRPGLRPYLGKQIVIGLRPAAFAVAPPAPVAPTLRVVPLGVEALGDEKHLLFDAPRNTDGADAGTADDVPITVDEAAMSQLWTAKVAQHADVAIGRPVVLSLDLREAYFFDPRTGAAIPAAGTGAAEPVTAGALSGGPPSRPG